MPEVLDDFYAEKRSIINELFIATADDNYVAARWCFRERLNVDFFWLAVHSVEKYLKAILLLNLKSAKQYGHDIVKLYAAATPLAPELFPAMLVKPERMPVEHWHVESAEQYVVRLYRDGQADNRYKLFGYSRYPEDLWKLDQLVFSIRRVCRPLEAYEMGRPVEGVTNISHREVLRRYPTRWKPQSKLEETMSGKHGDALLHAALNWNFPFAPSGYEHSPTTYTSSSENPVLVRRLYDPLEAGPKHFAHADVLWQWVKGNIQPPKSLITEIEDERSKIKAKSGAETP